MCFLTIYLSMAKSQPTKRCPRAKLHLRSYMLRPSKHGEGKHDTFCWQNFRIYKCYIFGVLPPPPIQYATVRLATWHLGRIWPTCECLGNQNVDNGMGPTAWSLATSKSLKSSQKRYPEWPLTLLGAAAPRVCTKGVPCNMQPLLSMLPFRQ